MREEINRICSDIKNIFEYIGEDPDREGLMDTPKRMLRSWDHLFSGYRKKPSDILSITFNEGSCDEMVILNNIEFYSTCEHHFLPFFGTVSIGYLPDKKVVGISKLARLVEVFSRRLQIQERMTTQIADSIDECISPKGSMVLVKAHHFCISSRGVEKKNAQMITSAVRGLFMSEMKVRQEFLDLIRG